jgi:hypothetical protein
LIFSSTNLQNLRFEEGGFLGITGGGLPTQYYVLGAGDNRNISAAILGGGAPLSMGNGDLFIMINRAVEPTFPLAANITPQDLTLRDPDNFPIYADSLHGNALEIDSIPPDLSLALPDSFGIPALEIAAADNIPIFEIFYRIAPACWNPILVGGSDIYFETTFVFDEFAYLPDGEYEIEICAVDAAGNRSCEIFDMDWPAGVDPGTPASETAGLVFKAAPSPFVAQTCIHFTAAEPSRAEVSIHAPNGRLIRVLADEYVHAGDYRWVWDGRNASHHQVAAGSYFVRLRLNDEIHTRKIVKLR